MTADDDKLALYQILQSHRQNAEKNFWSRIQTLHAIQAGILAGGFFLMQAGGLLPWVAAPLFILGAILTGLLRHLLRNDWYDANANKKAMRKLEKKFCINRTAGFDQRRRRHRSHRIQFRFIGIFFWIDIVLAVVSIASAIWGRCLL